MDTKSHGSAMHELKMEGRHSRGFTMQVAVHMNIPELHFSVHNIACFLPSSRSAVIAIQVDNYIVSKQKPIDLTCSRVVWLTL